MIKNPKFKCVICDEVYGIKELPTDEMKVVLIAIKLCNTHAEKIQEEINAREKSEGNPAGVQCSA